MRVRRACEFVSGAPLYLAFLGEIMFRKNYLLPTLLAVIATSQPVCGGEKTSAAKRCWRNFVRRAKEKEVEWKRCCRSCTQNWFRNRPQPDYGLKLRANSGRTTSRVLVAFVHGLNSRPEDLTALVRDVEQAGFACATFRYPNDQSLSSSAMLLSRELRRVKRQSSNVVIVSHSMGSLIAREAVENPKLDPGNVDRLIMIAPPNHGSQLAKVAFSLDLFEYIASGDRRGESGFVYGSILDGLSEATDDLKPESAFLRKLNSRPRNAEVCYTIVLGTGGPLRKSHLRGVDRCVSKMADRCQWVDRTYARLGSKFSRFDELIAGHGDGVVSVQRGRLDGVDDVILGSFEHNELLHDNPDREVLAVRRQIVARIESE